MNIKEKMKSYSFWVSLTSAVVLVVKLIGQKYGLVIDDGFISDLVTSLCGILVILGIIVLPAKKDNKEDKTKSNLTKPDNENCNNDDLLNSISNQIEEDINNIITKNVTEDPIKQENETETSEPKLETELNVSNEELEETKDDEDFLNNDNVFSISKNTIEEPLAITNIDETETKLNDNESLNFDKTEEKLRSIFENPDKLEALNQILCNFLENKNHNE